MAKIRVNVTSLSDTPVAVRYIERGQPQLPAVVLGKKFIAAEFVVEAGRGIIVEESPCEYSKEEGTNSSGNQRAA